MEDPEIIRQMFRAANVKGQGETTNTGPSGKLPDDINENTDVNVHQHKYAVRMSCNKENVHALKERYSRYIESVRGLISASDFEMHVTYLHSTDKERFQRYEDYLLETTLVEHVEVRKRFLEYVDALRSGKITRDEFEVHVSCLREYSDVKISRENQYKYRTLLRETKKFFWTIAPSDCKSQEIFNNKSMENLCRTLSAIDYETVTLGEVLKPLGLLGLVGDFNVELVNSLKKMLVHFHPDKNKHEKAKEIFMLITENVYNPVLIILEEFEKYTNCTYFSCELDEFLNWRIRTIKDIRKEEEKNFHFSLQSREKAALAVYNHLLSKTGPVGNFGYSILDDRFKWQRPAGTFTMEHYQREKANILNEKDNILEEYRRLLKEYLALTDTMLLYKRKKAFKENLNVESASIGECEIECLNNSENYVEYMKSKIIEIEDLKADIEKRKEIIKESENYLKDRKKRMKSMVEYFIPLYEPMIEKYEKEIHYLKDVCANKIVPAERRPIPNEGDQAEVDRYRRNIKQEKLNIFVHMRRLRLYRERLVEIKKEKVIMETLLAHLSKETEKPGGYKGKLKYCMVKGIKTVISLFSWFFFHYDYGLPLNCDVDNQKLLVPEYINMCHEYEKLKSKCKSVKGTEYIEKLRSFYTDLKSKYKTGEEMYKESQSNKRREDKKELLEVIKERKKTEIKVEEAEIRAEKAERDVEVYKMLLLRIKNGDLPIDKLNSMHLEFPIAGPSWRN